MKSFLRKPVVWKVITALVVAAIAIKVAIVLVGVMWLIAAIREPNTYLYPFLIPAAIAVSYASKTGALVVGGCVAVFAIYTLWIKRDQPIPTAPPALYDDSKEQGPRPQ